MYNNNYNSRTLFKSNDNYKLPSFEWQKKTELINSFNNELVKGFKSGLNLYDPQRDLKLFNNLDLEPISTDNVNFDKINDIVDKNYNKNDDIYNNSKAAVSGAIDQINKSANDTMNNVEKSINDFKNYFKNLFDFDFTNLKIYGGLFLLFIILNKQ